MAHDPFKVLPKASAMNRNKNKRNPCAFKALQEENQKLKRANVVLRRQSDILRKSLSMFSTNPLQKGIS